LRPLALLLLPLPLVACADYALTESKGDNDMEEAPASDTGWGGAGDGDWANDTGDTAPPEEEEDQLRLLPAGTDAYVFIANPDRDTVTRIAVPSLEARTTAVGATPSIVLTTSDYAYAVTLNEGDDTVSVVDADTLEVISVGVRQNFNSLSMSGDGRWAMAWYDPDRESSGGNGGVVSFNEVSFVDLRAQAHTPMAVGFNPRSVKWSQDGTLALVVSDASLALVDLTAATLAPTLISLSDDPTDAPPAEEVELSDDGRYAFVRQFGADEIVVVDLVDRVVERVPVGQNPTDLDLSPDGRQLAIVSRGAQQLTILDPGNPFAGGQVIDLPQAYGSVLFAGGGERALLYTNATALDRLGVWDVTTGAITERSLVKPVASMGVSPTGDSLLVFHTKTNASDMDSSSPFYSKWALTLIDLDDFRQNPMLLPAEPTAYTVSDDGRYGYFIMENQRLLETLDFSTLLYTEVRLPSVPEHLGVLPSTTTAWASQVHDLGRISFYDPATDALDTITGFELNSDIEH
jgi:DNA-binding beta-propeller fold protein YncE